MAAPSLEFIQSMLERVLEGQRRADVKLDRIIDDVSDLKIRMTASEEAVAGINRRLDRVEHRLDRIEKQLDLVTAPS